MRSSKDEPSVGGKTGSAQVKRITMAQRASSAFEPQDAEEEALARPRQKAAA